MGFSWGRSQTLVICETSIEAQFQASPPFNHAVAAHNAEPWSYKSMTASGSSGVATSPGPSLVNKRLLPWLVAVAFFMESLDTTILNTAVPAISTALHLG